MTAGVKRQSGRPVCATAWDERGRAHIRHPMQANLTVCGRLLEQAGKPTGKSCGACSEKAAAANKVLRQIVV